MQCRLLENDEIKPFLVMYDKTVGEFFYISRVDNDTIITNNNIFNNYLCLWDYEFDQLNIKDVEMIRRILDKDNMLIVTQCEDKQSCECILKELVRMNNYKQLKNVLKV